ncbi:PREDICTED: protein FAM193A [Condylura cristata]|uniref:protein FAM193A n=1 Tax=Condylura cristata TaxID=143302 RepID=UPI000643361C|nr:PREDICTED: protein FAM193A [Condylura cristata]
MSSSVPVTASTCWMYLVSTVEAAACACEVGGLRGAAVVFLPSPCLVRPGMAVASDSTFQLRAEPPSAALPRRGLLPAVQERAEGPRVPGERREGREQAGARHGPQGQRRPAPAALGVPRLPPRGGGGGAAGRPGRPGGELCERDPYQLYQRLEQQAREYVLEMKARLLRQLAAASRVKAPSGLQGPPQAHQFISLLLEEYGALCQAARTISTFLGTLVSARPSPSRQAAAAPDACECHVCKQEASGLPASAVTAAALPPGHQFVSPEKPTHPALHLYPHIHGHVPLHAVPHLPRPLIHPTLYAAPPFTHSKALPPAPVQNHTNKRQVFSASLQDHIYPSCFGNTPEWTSSKFISLWGAQVMNDKDWNPGTFLPDTVSGPDVLGPALSEARPEALPPPPSTEPPPESKEKKNPARKKCLYNFQDAFMEANKVVMATSSATSSVSCTATTVQSSNSQFKVSSKRPPSLGEAACHRGRSGVGAGAGRP